MYKFYISYNLNIHIHFMIKNNNFLKQKTKKKIAIQTLIKGSTTALLVTYFMIR